MIPFLGRAIDKRYLGESVFLPFKQQQLLHIRSTISSFLAFLNEGGKGCPQYICPLLLQKVTEWKNRPKQLRLQDQSQDVKMIYKLRVNGLSLDYKQNGYLHNYKIKPGRFLMNFQRRKQTERKEAKDSSLLTQVLEKKEQEEKSGLKSLLREKIIKKQNPQRASLIASIKSRLHKTESYLEIDSILFDSIEIASQDKRNIVEIVTRWAGELGDGVPSKRHLIDFGFWRNGLPSLQVYKFVQ